MRALHYSYAFLGALTCIAVAHAQAPKPAAPTIRFTSCPPILFDIATHPNGVHAAARYVPGTDNTIRSADILRSSGFEDIDEQILRSIRSCTLDAPVGESIALQTERSIPVFVAPDGTLHAGERPKLLNVRECAPTAADYPAWSIRDNEAGLVKVRFTVDTDGKVVASEVARTSGHTRLDQQSIRILHRCRFAPGKTLEGAGVGGTFVVDFRWRISG